MAHYAFINENNIVTEVITGRNETESVGGIYGETAWEAHYAEFRPGMYCKRTSYNAAINGFRKNYAGIGYTYDEARDAFIPPKPFESWTLDEAICLWKAPIAIPNDEKKNYWDEETTSWLELPPLV
jgi:hypothetical protein